jgi:hypothetical protein
LLAEKTANAAELRDKALDLLEVAKGRLGKIEAPAALIKTEEDFRMRLFVGNGIGQIYNREESRAIAVLQRGLSRVLTFSVDSMKTFRRCEEILGAGKTGRRARTSRRPDRAMQMPIGPMLRLSRSMMGPRHCWQGRSPSRSRGSSPRRVCSKRSSPPMSI